MLAPLRVRPVPALARPVFGPGLARPVSVAITRSNGIGTVLHRTRPVLMGHRGPVARYGPALIRITVHRSGHHIAMLHPRHVVVLAGGPVDPMVHRRWRIQRPVYGRLVRAIPGDVGRAMPTAVIVAGAATEQPEQNHQTNQPHDPLSCTIGAPDGPMIRLLCATGCPARPRRRPVPRPDDPCRASTRGCRPDLKALAMPAYKTGLQPPAPLADDDSAAAR